MFDRADIIRKDINIPIKIWNKIKLFSFKQFTIQDTLNFHYDVENKPLWIFDFLNKHWDKKKWFWNHKLSKKEFMNIPFNTLYQTVVWNAMEWFYDFEQQVKKWNKLEDTDEYPLAAYIAFVAKELCINPIDIIARFTPQQLKAFSWGITWNINSQSEKWEIKNKRILNLRKIEKMDKNKMNTSLDSLRNIHNKQIWK